MSPQRRLKLLREVFLDVFRETGTFEEGKIGAELAYLMGAISGATSGCEFEMDTEIVQILRRIYSDGHSVWQFIEIVDWS